MARNRRKTKEARTALKLFTFIAGKLGASEADQAMPLGVSRGSVLSSRCIAKLDRRRATASLLFRGSAKRDSQSLAMYRSASFRFRYDVS